MKRTAGGRGPIDAYFKVSKRNEEGAPKLDSPQKSVEEDIESEPTVSGAPVQQDTAPDAVLVQDPSDIGNWIGKSLEDATKLRVLHESGAPGQDFTMPFTERKSGGKMEKRCLRFDHFQKFPWLGFSKSKDGLFCKVCVLFNHAVAGRHSDQQLKCLVSLPLKRYDHLTGKDGYLTTHDEREYHKLSMLQASEFERRMKEPSREVVNLMDKSMKEKIQKNRLLASIVKTVIFLGQNGLAFCGNKDCSKFSIEKDDDETKIKSEGNFRNLIRFRVEAGDNVLKQHIEESKKNATYFSPHIQNLLIDACGDVIITKILSEIKHAKFFSILADETLDTSTKEQMCLCIRYFHKNKVQEKFLKFVDIVDLTGAGLARTILEELDKLGLNAIYLIGQGYDGASAMSGQFSGVQAEIRKKHSKAVYVHCASHCLNLMLSRASKVPAIQQCVIIATNCVNFLTCSAARKKLFQEHSELEENRKKNLKKFCETRWVERHSSILTFCEMFDVILDTLAAIPTWPDANVAAKAKGILNSLQSSQFLISLAILNKVLALTINVSRSLQKINSDLCGALKQVKNIKDILHEWKNDEETFLGIFNQALKLSEEAGTELNLPRLPPRYRQSNCAIDAQTFFKQSIFEPFLEGIEENFDAKFGAQQAIVFGLSGLIPANFETFDYSSIKPAVEFYSEFLESSDQVSAEYTLWRRSWVNCDKDNMPSEVIDTLMACNESFYPNIKVLLHIFVTIPVTTASNERMFSNLKFLKSYLRSTMNESRLNGLALLYTSSNCQITVDDVIDKFVAKNRRRVDFVI